MKNNTRTKIHNLKNYAVLGGAAIALPVGGHATTIVIDQTIGANAPSATYTLDIHGAPELTFGTYQAPAGDPAFTEVSSTATSEIVGNSTTVTDLAPGDVVGPSSPFSAEINVKLSGGFSSSGFPSDGSTPGDLGFEYSVNGQEDYGFVQLTTSVNGTAASATIQAVTYDDSGAPVTVFGTAVPEPASLALLAAGAVGLEVFRRRRTRTAEK